MFIEERNQSWNTPYLFNGKELDEETGLYYYGARYYNPRESVWLSVDPLSGYNPIMETEHYIDGLHNKGVFNSFNLNTYGYCYQNPVVLIDPNGRQIEAPNLIGIAAHAAFARYMNTISGISGNWKPESPLFRDFRPDLLYYGGNTNESGMGAVWELKPFTQSLDTKYSISSVLQINHYVDELNAREEGGLTWATGTTALGTPKPFEGTLTLMCDKYQFLYYITYPEQGFIYYSYEQLKQPEPEKVPQSVPQLPPVVVPAVPQTKPTSSPSGRGAPALLDKILRFPIFIISSPIIEFYNNSNNIDPRIT
ncbi:RHS repeat-associated core domain-containing protein [Apibacter adventoris]|uniref:RHS repeat-associated core domain-containing protein n=1 Tax=Apibacter adventoris TaxID=1679466 RepID=UPI0026CD2E50